MSVLWDALNDVSVLTICLLLLSLGIALFYEMINGFHDTANAVAMIIYTHSMKAKYSVIMSGIMNFLGVLLGGIGVAYAIVHLLPLDLMVETNQNAALAMVYSLLIAAVVWNFGTWYFALPVSSSHSLIGSIIGVSTTFGLLHGFDLAHSVNWKVVYTILIGLALSPLIGAGFSFILMKLARKYITNPKLFRSPSQEEKRKHPSFLARMAIVATGAGVSFAHGSNDGQKGIGLIMIILIGILPGYYALDMSSHHYKIAHIRDAANNLSRFYADNNATLIQLVNGKRLMSALKTKNTIAECSVDQVDTTLALVASKINGLNSYADLTMKERWSMRTAILCSDHFFAQAEKAYLLIDKDKSDYISHERKQLVAATEYAPYWVVFAVALAIGIGTMIGYKRIVHTIGEKIGSNEINYMQGTVAQTTAMITILAANVLHAPVSTTHILSSAVTGSMLSKSEGGVQKGTIKVILLSWLFTLPVTALMGSGIYICLNFFMK